MIGQDGMEKANGTTSQNQQNDMHYFPPFSDTHTLYTLHRTQF